MRITTRLLLIVLILLNSRLLFSQVDNSNIDEMIEKKDLANLNNYLASKKNTDEYDKIEQYIIKKAKSLILKGEYDYAGEVIKVVLSVNHDSEEAQKIYLSLQKVEKKEEEVKKEEAQVKLTEKKKITFDNFLIAYDFGALNFMLYQSQYYYEKYDEVKINFKYGMSTDFAFYFNHPYVSIGLEGYFDAYFLDIYPESGTQTFYRIISAASTPFIKVPLYFCFGVSHLIYTFKENQTKDVLLTSVISVVIGLKFTRWYFNKYIGIDASIYYYLVSPFTSYIDAMFDSTFSLLVRFYQFKRYGFIIRSDLIGLFIISNGKLENNVKLEFSIGMGINDK